MDFVKKLEDTEIIVIEKMDANDTVNQDAIDTYYSARNQVEQYLQSLYDANCSEGEFGCIINLPTEPITIGVTEGTRTSTSQNFNEKLYEALKKDEDNCFFRFMEFLNMVAEGLRMKVYGLEDDEINDIIDDPLNIRLFSEE